MKFKTDKTQGGYPILSIHGPDHIGEYAGVIEDSSGYIAAQWGSRGTCYHVWGHNKDSAGLALVPVEPVIHYRYFAAKHAQVSGNDHGFGQDSRHHLKLGFDAETGELLSAEVLK